MSFSYLPVGKNINKLTLLYGLLITLIIGVILLFIRFNTHSIQKYESISNLSAKKLSLLLDIRKNADFLQVQTFRMTIDTSMEVMRVEEKMIRLAKAQNDSLYEEYSKYISNKNEQELFNELIKRRSENNEAREKLIKINYTYGADISEPLHFQQSVQQSKYEAYHNGITTLSNYLVADTNIKIKEVVSFIRESKIVIYGSLLILFILLMVLGHTIVLTIKKLKLQNDELNYSKENLEEQKLYSESILKAIPVGIVGVNDAGQIVVFNKEAELMFGYKTSEIIGQHLSLLIPNPNKKFTPQNIHQYFKAPGEGPIDDRAVTLLAKRKDGEMFISEISLSIIDFKQKKIALASIKELNRI